MKTVYVLQLKGNKYYVGTTTDLDQRYAQHLNGNGSEWTRIYPPIKVLNSYIATSIFDEDKTTKELMAIYGIDNVRGGAHTSIEFPEDEEIFLQQEIWHAKGCCIVCGRSGHFAGNCVAKTTIDGDQIIFCCGYCDRDFPTKEEAQKHEERCSENPKNISYPASQKIRCYKCGKFGHYANNCKY